MPPPQGHAQVAEDLAVPEAHAESDKIKNRLHALDLSGGPVRIGGSHFLGRERCAFCTFPGLDADDQPLLDRVDHADRLWRP